ECAAGTRVELVEGVRGEADEQRAGESPRGQKAHRRNAEQLEHARRASASNVRAEAALGAAPEVVGKAEGRDRGNVGTVGEPDLPADERQSKPAEVDPERATGVERVAQLPRAVQEPVEVAAGGAVTKRQLDLAKPKTGSGRV